MPLLERVVMKREKMDKSIPGKKIKKLEMIYKCVSCHRRIRIIKLLFPDREINVGEIAGEIGLSVRSTSKHILQMENGGFLVSRHPGVYKICKLNPDAPEIVSEIIRLIIKAPGIR